MAAKDRPTRSYDRYSMTAAKTHILIIDDDRDIRNPLAEFLGRNGLRCTVAADGKEMDEKLAASSIDLIVLDIMLPGEDGFSICRRLQETVRVPIILLTIRRFTRILPILQSVPNDQIVTYLGRVSHCHDGYTLSEISYQALRATDQTDGIGAEIARALAMDGESIRVGFATFGRGDFAYRECEPTEMQFPLEGMVVSLRIAPGQWLNAEIHPHEWHVTPSMNDWLIRSGAVFLLIGGIALLFVRRLSKPFKNLTDAAKSFAADFKVTELDETGPLDVKRAIRSFNMMQRQVTDEMKRRTHTLAAISHDIRSPLTALRVKAELIEDPNVRADHIASIDKMERITASALAFLRGESRNEPKRQVDLGTLVECECVEFRESGATVSFECAKTINYACRPDALTRAVDNLIENAIKYAGSAHVSVEDAGDYIEISVSDHGPGIPDNKIASVLAPFERLSDARNSDAGGFGLGLAIARAVAEGHDGGLRLEPNDPTGLVVVINLPMQESD